MQTEFDLKGLRRFWLLWNTGPYAKRHKFWL